MEPTDLDSVAGLAATALSDIGPQVLVIGAAGIGLVALFTVYTMVTTGTKTKGKKIG